MAKPTKEDIEARIEYTLFLLSRRLYKSDIKRMLIRKYSIGARTCENYLSRAREILIKGTGQTKEEHRVASLNFYESIIAGPDSTLRDRIYANERLDKLLGLEAPLQHDVTSHGEYIMEVIETVVSKEDLANDQAKTRIADAQNPEGLPNEQKPL
jgi:hypothetical protein